MEKKLEQLIRERMRLQINLLVILCCCYFTIPLALIWFPEIMNQTTLFGGMSLTWLHTFLLIPLTWILGWVYWQKAKQLDKKVQAVLQEE